MSTAVLETPREAAEKSLERYTMPGVSLGQFVMFYPDAGTNEAVALVTKVIGIERDQLVLETGSHPQYRSMTLGQKYHVRHRTDPQLGTNNSFVLKNGCWDYTPWEKAQRAEIDELKATVAKLVSDLGGTSAKSGKKGE
jgi:hypothetical protein